METKEWTFLREGWVIGGYAVVYVDETKSNYRIVWYNGEEEIVDHITGIRICIAMDDELAHQFVDYAEMVGLGTFDPYQIGTIDHGTIVGIKDDDGTVNPLAIVHVSLGGYEFDLLI
jgi:hypothetical protein